ncbi:MAG: nucleotidyltransferase domain-containing protein [Spirochaetota bacterium]
MDTKTEKEISYLQNTVIPSLKGCFGDDLGSVTLYGSLATGNFIKGVSDINLLVILNKHDAAKITQCARLTHRILSKKKITLLILTRDEFLNSSDVFPMEYLDIRETGRLMYGNTDAQSLKIDNENLRLEVEEHLRGSITHLRQLILASGGKKRPLSRSLKNWYGAQSALFRGILRLKGINPISQEEKDTARYCSELFGLQGDSFADLIALRKGEAIDPVKTAEGILTAMTGLAVRIDKLNP